MNTLTHLGGAADQSAHAITHSDVGAKLISLSTVESDSHLTQAERKFGRTFEQLSGMAAAQVSACRLLNKLTIQAASENVVLSDTLGYQALNARAGKDALSQRTQLLEDSQTATKSAITKRRNVERLKASSSISSIKVDDAISEMDEANTLETSLSSRLNAMSTNLHVAIRAHSRQTYEDVAISLLENARLTVGFHKHLLRELEALRPDLAKIGSAAAMPRAPAKTTTPIIQAAPPTMPTSRPYQPMPQVQGSSASISQSMFLPQPAHQHNTPRPQATGPAQVRADPPDPLGGHMAQSMMLPGQQGMGQRAQTIGRAGARSLDERQAAKLLAGGFR